MTLSNQKHHSTLIGQGKRNMLLFRESSISFM